MTKKFTLEEIFNAMEEVRKLEINWKLKEDIMNMLIWGITEINGKWKVKYRSEGAKGIKDIKLLNHEHVISRNKLKKELAHAKNSEEIKEIINKIEACIVTRDEHKKLKKGIEGWEKYKQAGIKVFDDSGKEVDIEFLCKK